MFTPFRLRGLELANRVVVSPMDMYSLGRRHAGRLPPRAPRRAGDRRRRAGDDRDDLHERRRADHARLRRALPRRARRRVEADRRLRARALARGDRRASSATPGARARRSCCGRARTSRCRDGNWPLIAPSPLPYLPGVIQVPREMTRADMDAVRERLRRRDAAGRRGGLRPARDPHGARLPAVELPLAADQRARRRVRRATARSSRSRCSPRAARCGRPRSR